MVFEFCVNVWLKPFTLWLAFASPSGIIHLLFWFFSNNTETWNWYLEYSRWLECGYQREGGLGVLGILFQNQSYLQSYVKSDTDSHTYKCNVTSQHNIQNRILHLIYKYFAMGGTQTHDSNESTAWESRALTYPGVILCFTLYAGFTPSEHSTWN